MTICTVLWMFAVCMLIVDAYGIWQTRCLRYAHLMMIRQMIVKDTLRAAEAEGLNFEEKAERVKGFLAMLDKRKPLPAPPPGYGWWVERTAEYFDPLP